MTVAALLLSAALGFSSEPCSDVFIHQDRVEFVKIDSEGVSEREIFWFAWSPAPDGPLTIDDCVASAQIACGAAGIKRLYYRVNPTTGEAVCDFECNSTGTGG